MAGTIRTYVDNLVRSYIVEEARADNHATAARLAAQVRRRLRRKGMDKPLPKERTIQSIAKSARLAEPSIDDPWSPSVYDSRIPSDATLDLLAVWKASLIKDQGFSIRMAIRAARIRFAFKPASPQDLLPWSDLERILYCSGLYADREKSAEHDQKPINTADLDAELAFQPWRSSVHRWQYDQAVATKVIPPSGWHDGWDTEDLFFEEARSLVGEVIGREEYWWLPEAMGVISFWLKEFSGRLPQWRPVFWDMLESEDWKSWKTMGRGLAKEVISWAKELDQSESKRRSAFDFRDEDPREPWEPKETIKEVALIEFSGPGQDAD